jgi:hypothetical protein
MSFDEISTKRLLALMENMIIENRTKKLTQEEIEKKCVEMGELVDMGANFKCENTLNGSTVLHFAAMGMDLKLIECLFIRGVNMNVIVEEHLTTPLHYTCMQAHPDNKPDNEQMEKIKDTICIFLLLGSNARSKCKRNMRPIEYITKWTNKGPYHNSIFDYLYSLERGKNLGFLAEYVMLKKKPVLIRAFMMKIHESYEKFNVLMLLRYQFMTKTLSLEIANQIFVSINFLAYRNALFNEK